MIARILGKHRSVNGGAPLLADESTRCAAVTSAANRRLTATFFRRDPMSRMIDCPCGQQLRAANDEGLFRAARQHVTDHHPDMNRTDDELRQLIRERARDDVTVTR